MTKLQIDTLTKLIILAVTFVALSADNKTCNRLIEKEDATIICNFKPKIHRGDFLIFGFNKLRIITANIKLKNKSNNQLDFCTKMFKITSNGKTFEGHHYMPIADDYLGNSCNVIRIKEKDSIEIQIDWILDKNMPEEISKYDFIYDPNVCKEEEIQN